MKKYEVEIVAKIRKTIEVEAENEDEASELAHDEFSVLNDGTPEEYDQETLRITEVK